MLGCGGVLGVGDTRGDVPCGVLAGEGWLVMDSSCDLSSRSERAAVMPGRSGCGAEGTRDAERRNEADEANDANESRGDRSWPRTITIRGSRTSSSSGAMTSGSGT